MNESGKHELLSNEEARQLTEHLAALTKAGVALAPALQAAADEIPSRRLAHAMHTLATELSAGRSLESVLAAHPRFLPDHMQKLIEAGIQSGNLSEVLVQLVDIDRTSVDLRRSIRMAIAYPALLLTLVVVLIVFVSWVVIPEFSRMFLDFRTDLPQQTQILMWLSGGRGLIFVALAAAVVLIVLLALRWSISDPGWRRLVVRVPFIGPMLLWRSVADWSRLVALLLDQGLSLPDSLRLAGTGINDSLVAAQGLEVSKATAYGRQLGDALYSLNDMPASLAALVQWGESHGALPDAFRTASEMFENRVKLRSALLQSILPPVAFILVMLMAFFLVTAMFLPLVKLITDLSGGSIKLFR